MFIISPLYVYLLGGALAGWLGHVIVSPEPPTGWNPKEHREMILMCRKACSNHIKRYEPLTGDCVCELGRKGD